MPTHPTIDLLKSRRSVKPDMLTAPAPSADELETILTIAARVPDHKKLAPWRFVIIDGEARDNSGNLPPKRAARRKQSRRRTCAWIPSESAFCARRW